MTGPDRRPVSAGEVAALTRRLCALSEAGRDTDHAERAELLADKRDLLDGITDQHDRNDDGSEVETMFTDQRRDEDDRVEGDREAVWAEAPAAPIGGLWFTLDDDAPGGTRPLTETEHAEIAARVQATHDRALARDDEEPGPPSRYAGDDGAAFDDDQGWAR